MTTALDIITGALRKIGQYAAGETLDAVDQQDALNQLNDLLDSWSTEHLAVYNNVENILTLTPGKGVYTVGNPVLGTFIADTVSASAVLINASVPGNLVVGSFITGAGIAAGSKVASFTTNTVTLTLACTGSFAAQAITYTGPGDFAIDRPLRVTNCYTRITPSGSSMVDYPCNEYALDTYASIGLKNQPGPWPKIFYLDTSYPLAKLYFWPVSSQAGELHLWTDQLFTTLNATDPLNLPQGYSLALQCALACLLAPEYGVQPNPLLVQQAAQMKTTLKRLNSAPQSITPYDSAIVGRNMNDAGFILHGGF